MTKWIAGVAGAAIFMVAVSLNLSAQNQMSFFVTSVGSGNGANLGGLTGADKHCQTLAAAVGAGNRTWRAYLSQAAIGGLPAVNARDRIGKGPWMNVKGEVIAKDVASLHSDMNNLTKQTALTEKGGVVNGVGDRMLPAATGQAPPMAPARRSWDTPIVRDAARRECPGTRRIRHAAARSPTWWPPAATATSTASPRTRRLDRLECLILSQVSPGKTSARVRAGKADTGTSEAHMLYGLRQSLASSPATTARDTHVAGCASITGAIPAVDPRLPIVNHHSRRLPRPSPSPRR
jgi:hypothetical protein